MADKLELTGGCLCGAVKIKAIANNADVAACHCAMCRRWSSSPFMAVSGQGVEFEGEESVRRFRSSDWAERGFCSKCGSNLFYHIIDSDEYQIAAGLIDDHSAFRLSLQVYTDKKPHYYAFANETPTMTEAEVIAAFAPPAD